MVKRCSKTFLTSPKGLGKKKNKQLFPSEVVSKNFKKKQKLSVPEVKSVLTNIMNGENSSPAQVAAFLSLLSIRPSDNLISSDILKACAEVMLEFASSCKITPDPESKCNEFPLIDIVGTGGDGKDAFNVSTASSFIVAACGCRLAKHGNRSSSGSVGSADFLEALGVNISLNSSRVSALLSENGFAFLFAPLFHSSMAKVASIRREIGVKTIFNLLGPLTNPVQPEFQLSGVADVELGPLYVELLHKLGRKNPMVVHSFDGLDELSICSPSHLWTVDKNGQVKHQEISPTDFGLALYSEPLEQLPKVTGGTAQERADNFLDIINRKFKNSPLYDFIVLNSALALVAAGITPSYKEAASMARSAIESGKAKTVFEEYKTLTNQNPTQKKDSNPCQLNKDNSSRETILQTIAHKTREDLATRKNVVTLDTLKEKIALNPPPIDFAKRICRAGNMAVLSEIKRASPSKGDIQPDIDVASQVSLYADAGAAAISILTEPHWFKGNLSDMETARATVDHFNPLTRPAILRKDFLLDAYQIYEARAFGADTVLLIVSLFDSEEKLRELVNISRELGMEPLVEVNSLEETTIAISVGAKVIGINNRNLHTFNVDMTTTEDILANVQLSKKNKEIQFIALSGIQTRSDVARFEKIGVRGVLVGEALMRSTNPSAMIKSFMQSYCVPYVKICGVTTVAGAASAIESGADMIGLVFASSGRRVSTEQGKEITSAIRYLSKQSNQNNRESLCAQMKVIRQEPNVRRRLGRYSVLLEKEIRAKKPLIVGVFANQTPAEVLRIAREVDLDVIQLSGANDSFDALDELNSHFFIWKAIHASSRDSVEFLLNQVDTKAATCTNILFDTRDSSVSGGTGKAFDWSSVADLSNIYHIPFMLAGGLCIDNICDAVAKVFPFGVDVSSGVEISPGVKCPHKVKVFVELAKLNGLPSESVRQIREGKQNRGEEQSGLCLASLRSAGWFGDFGGRYAPESLMQALEELEAGYYKAIADPLFQAELNQIATHYIGRSTPLYNARQLTEYCKGARIWLKREDLNHTGAHKINNAIGQAILAKRLGKKRIIAETGAGQHGVATATACAMLKLECIVYMGAEDCRRQALNVFRMKNLGATVVPVQSGSKTLKDAINEAMRDWVTNVATTHYLVGSAIGPHPFPVIVRDFQSVIGRETKRQMLLQAGKLPDAVIACVGGGSNAIGMFHPFVDDPVLIYGVEAAGEGVEIEGRHSATIVAGRPGILHGTRTCLLQNEQGQITTTHSVSAGLDYPGVGPEHAYLADSGRATYVPIDDSQAMEGFKLLNELEGIVPALESSHALCFGFDLAKQLSFDQDIVICVSGRGDKDMNTVAEVQGVTFD
mmetsp:Transcript_127600/g.190214  ORF Transcript_127600/g.190214 Transcript_127600/m.190214 type:complete len:1356 (-) Transcript_127600:29-4096(-)